MAGPRLLDNGRRERLFFGVLSLVLVLIRCFPSAWYEQLQFDSDQAIVGLMAKHLAEGRAFPLFFYGQHYMLGVQSWLAAPLFLIGGPTLLMLRIPLVAINCAVGVLLLSALVRYTALRPAFAFAAALPLLAPSPLVSTLLLQTLGASIEPMLYVLLLWVLRRRAVPFGLLLAIGFLHREFTIFAVPALVFVLAGERTLFTRATLERALTVGLLAAGVWIVVDQLKARVDVYGPRTGPLENASLGVELQVLVQRLCFQPRALWGNIRSMLVDCLPDLFGGRTFPLEYYGVNSRLSAGSSFLGWFLVAAGVLVTARLVPLLRRARFADVSFLAYMALVGVQAIVVYPFACEIIPGYPGIVRYTFLALFIPVAMAAAYLKYETIPALRAAALGILIVWGATNFAGTLRLIHEYRTTPPENKSREFADYLVAQGVRYARASYWDAYVLDFFSRERATIGSEGKFRIKEYENGVDSHRPVAWRIVRAPCPALQGQVGQGVQVIQYKGHWCLVPPRRQNQ